MLELNFATNDVCMLLFEDWLCDVFYVIGFITSPSPVGERKEKPSASTVSKTTTAPPPAASKLTSTAANPTKAPAERSANQTPPSSTAPTQTTPTMVSGPSPLQVNLANVDLGKISSILSSITSAMKGSGETRLQIALQAAFRHHVPTKLLFQTLCPTKLLFQTLCSTKLLFVCRE